MPQATQSQLNVDQWAEGIAQYEQGSKPDARSVRNNNPGNLKYAKQFGATGYDKDGFAVFENKELGMKALKERKVSVFGLVAVGSTTVPRHSVLSIAITPPGRTRVSACS